jgi:hypothetical protein
VNFAGYTDAEIQRWLHMRAIEWSGFPGYLAQIIAPILFIFYPWWQVLLGVFLISLPWCIVRYWFVMPELSDKICLVVVWLTWPVCVGSAIYLSFHQQPVAGVVALLVPLGLAGVLTPPGKVGIIELKLAKSIGYVSPDAEI